MKEHREASKAKDLELIRKVPLFSGLSGRNLRYIAGIARRRKYGKNSVIFTENTLGKTIYIVVSGQVKIFTEFSSG